MYGNNSTNRPKHMGGQFRYRQDVRYIGDHQSRRSEIIPYIRLGPRWRGENGNLTVHVTGKCGGLAYGITICRICRWSQNPESVGESPHLSGGRGVG